MTDFCELQFRLWRTWLEFIEVYFATVATVSARLPIVAQAATGFGDHDARREARTMVTEKWRAAAAGAEAGALETAKAALKVMTGQTHPVAVAGHMMDVADAATRPARRKVRANARRLTQPRPAQRRGRDAES
jgi:hypothetical protein